MKMAKKDVSAIVSGAGLLTAVWTELVGAVREYGGTDEDIHRLSTPAGKKTIQAMAKSIVGSVGSIGGVSGLLSDWQKFYREVFGVELDLSSIHIPERRDGFDRLLVIAQGMTPNRIYAKCAELFRCWKYLDNLDEITSDRDPKNGAYAIWVRDRQEVDEELKNLSANDLKAKNITTETLPERLIHELKFFKEAGKHLDEKNWTLCAGSRGPGGNIPYVRWDGGGMGVYWCDPDGRFDYFRARAVVS